MKFVVREDNLTMGDLEDFYDRTGMTVQKAFQPVVQRDDDGRPVLDEDGRPVKDIDPSPRAINTLIWLVAKKDDPNFTYEDARNVKVSELELVPAEKGVEAGNAVSD